MNVGKIECEFVNATPCCLIAFITGAVVASTIDARNPSGTNRMILCGRDGWLAAGATPDSSAAVRAHASAALARKRVVVGMPGTLARGH